MLVALLIYVLILLGVGIYTGFKEKDYDTFVIAGRSRTGFLVFLSLMASMIGGSATFGIVTNGVEIGFPAFWWLGVGTIGLIFQSIFVSVKVRNFNAYTLADVGRITVGEGARLAICIIIVISWLGVIAGQFVALSQIFSVVTGKGNNTWLVAVVALVVVAFTATGGQLSVMRTDAIQFLVLFFGVAIAFIYLFFGPGSAGMNTDYIDSMQAFNQSFTPANLFYLLLIVGGTYFIGPDVLSRNMAAKNGKAARSASMIAAFVLLIFNFLIVGVSIWCRNNLTDFNGLNPLIFVMQYRLPVVVSFILALGLVSALLSSASTCLITTSSIIQNDIIRKKNIVSIRLLVCVIGIIATLIALGNQDILTILTAAYSVYAPGVVIPLFFAIWFYKKKRIHQSWWLIAVIVGSCCGLLGNFINFYWLPVVGMGLSLIFGICSLAFGKTKEIDQKSE